MKNKATTGIPENINDLSDKEVQKIIEHAINYIIRNNGSGVDLKIISDEQLKNFWKKE